ncbi:glycerate kinase [Mollicutes bacterium LVI A0039]|nr:glycerate kinase [Mollicutes bacterium LVI A0039]
MNILIAADSFKESLSSFDVGIAIKTGLEKSINCCCEVVSIADGGEGTMELITGILEGAYVNTITKDPLGREIPTKFGLSYDRKTAIIDVATSSGIELLAETEKNPMKTSSYGTGQLINAALEYDVESIILGLGSSATVDLGLGMLSALGAKFLDESGNDIIICGESLKTIQAIDISELNPKLKGVEIKVASDVNNPLVGPNGSVNVFARQKGATDEQIVELEQEFERIGQLLTTQLNNELLTYPGGGAAGGIGYICLMTLNSSLVSGSDLIMDLNRLQDKISKADLVITGEGRFDLQSLNGKGPMSIIKMAKQHQKQVIVVCGSVDNQIYNHEAVAGVPIFATITKVASLAETLSSAKANIEHTSAAIGYLYKLEN